MAKVEIRFDSDRPHDSEVRIDGKKVSSAYNLHLHLSATDVDFVLQKYVTDEDGRLICDENEAKKETIHLSGPPARVMAEVWSEMTREMAGDDE